MSKVHLEDLTGAEENGLSDNASIGNNNNNYTHTNHNPNINNNSDSNSSRSVSRHNKCDEHIIGRNLRNNSILDMEDRRLLDNLDVNNVNNNGVLPCGSPRGVNHRLKKPSSFAKKKKKNSSNLDMELASDLFKDTLAQLGSINNKRSRTSNKFDLRTQVAIANEMLEEREQAILKSVEMGQALLERASKLKHENEKLRKDLEDALQHNLAVNPLEIDSLKLENANLHQHIKRLQAERDEWKMNTFKLEGTLTELRQELNQNIRNERQQTAKAQQLRQKVNELLKQVEEYRTKMENTTQQRPATPRDYRHQRHVRSFSSPLLLNFDSPPRQHHDEQFYDGDDAMEQQSDDDTEYHSENSFLKRQLDVVALEKQQIYQSRVIKQLRDENRVLQLQLEEKRTIDSRLKALQEENAFLRGSHTEAQEILQRTRRELEEVSREKHAIEEKWKNNIPFLQNGDVRHKDSLLYELEQSFELAAASHQHGLVDEQQFHHNNEAQQLRITQLEEQYKKQVTDLQNTANELEKRILELNSQLRLCHEMETQRQHKERHLKEAMLSLKIEANRLRQENAAICKHLTGLVSESRRDLEELRVPLETILHWYEHQVRELTADVDGRTEEEVARNNLISNLEQHSIQQEDTIKLLENKLADLQHVNEVLGQQRQQLQQQSHHESDRAPELTAEEEQGAASPQQIDRTNLTQRGSSIAPHQQTRSESPPPSPSSQSSPSHLKLRHHRQQLISTTTTTTHSPSAPSPTPTVTPQATTPTAMSMNAVTTKTPQETEDTNANPSTVRTASGKKLYGYAFYFGMPTQLENQLKHQHQHQHQHHQPHTTTTIPVLQGSPARVEAPLPTIIPSDFTPPPPTVVVTTAAATAITSAATATSSSTISTSIVPTVSLPGGTTRSRSSSGSNTGSSDGGGGGSVVRSLAAALASPSTTSPTPQQQQQQQQQQQRAPPRRNLNF